MKRNIRFVLLGQLVLLIILFVFNLVLCIGNEWFYALTLYFDIPSLLLILIILILGLIIFGEWKNFTKAFSVGIKEYSLLE